MKKKEMSEWDSKELIKLAKTGDPEAQYFAGQKKLQGVYGTASHLWHPINRIFAKYGATTWYNKAAEQGYAPLLENRGSLF